MKRAAAAPAPAPAPPPAAAPASAAAGSEEEEDGWATAAGTWQAELTEEQPEDTAFARYSIAGSASDASGYANQEEVCTLKRKIEVLEEANKKLKAVEAENAAPKR